MNKQDMEKCGITPTPSEETDVEAVWFAGDHCGTILARNGQSMLLIVQQTSVEVTSRTTLAIA